MRVEKHESSRIGSAIGASTSGEHLGDESRRKEEDGARAKFGRAANLLVRYVEVLLPLVAAGVVDCECGTCGGRRGG